MENNSNIGKDNRKPLLSTCPNDVVNHPKHYTSDPSGVECIDIVKHRDFCIGNAIKYIWRCGLKHRPEANKVEILAKEIEDLEKARYYINCKIDMLNNRLARAIREQDEKDLAKCRLPLKEDDNALTQSINEVADDEDDFHKPVELIKPNRSPDYIKDKIYSDMNEV